jgi:hypothetical protein
MPDEDVQEPEATSAGADMGADMGADEQEAMRRLQEEIGRLTVTDHMLLMMHSLSSLALDRMGLAPETAVRKDLEQARLAIDAFKALLGLLEGKRPAEEMSAHRSVLSQLQMAYVAASEPAPPKEAPSGDEGPAAQAGGGELP